MLDPRGEARQLTTFADRLARLVPCHRDPERFHAETHALVGDLRRAARELELLARSQAVLAGAARPAPRGRRTGRLAGLNAAGSGRARPHAGLAAPRGRPRSTGTGGSGACSSIEAGDAKTPLEQRSTLLEAIDWIFDEMGRAANVS
ncbi:hypothetical protein [Methylobacterium tarhaniae]|uniref:hypothetical protein n=1 Tax=Methylobacterium tarhaniae TaxID=1187852 RepID=UPI003CFF4969